MRRPYVVVSNHESFVDILLISHLPTEMKWMSKVEMLRIPLVGWMMRLARDIPLTRSDSGSRSAALVASRERLDSKVSVMIFPEGTRSKTGELRDFHAGAFKLAIDAQVPILPLAVLGHPRRAAQARLAARLRQGRGPRAPAGRHRGHDRRRPRHAAVEGAQHDRRGREDLRNEFELARPADRRGGRPGWPPTVQSTRCSDAQ